MADFDTRIWNNERIFMIDFGRAKTGHPHMKFPDVDAVGYHDEANPNEHGPIISAINGAQRIAVRIFRTEISTGARLFVTSTDSSLVRITSPANGELGSDRNQRIEFTTGNPGRATIEVRYQWPDGPVIGRLYVQVNRRINIRLRLHLVTLNGLGHANNFLGQNCPSNADKHARMRSVLRQANHVWIPHGIFLTIDGAVQQTAWTAAELGSATQAPNWNDLMLAGALSPNRSATHVNVYFLPQWNISGVAAIGVPVPWARQQGYTYPVAAPPPTRHLSNAVWVRTNMNLNPKALAHEFGHYMNLCSLNSATGAVQQWHSNGDSLGGAVGVRDDLVTRRRMMYMATDLLNSNNPWRNDTGYGNLLNGGFITHRRLQQDITFEESARARAATTANFYAF